MIPYGSNSIANSSCEMHEDSNLIGLSWMKGDEPVRRVALNESSLGVYVKDYGNKSLLVFNGTDERDTGEYTCVGRVIPDGAYDRDVRRKTIYVQIASESCYLHRCCIHVCKRRVGIQCHRVITAVSGRASTLMSSLSRGGVAL